MSNLGKRVGIAALAISLGVWTFGTGALDAAEVKVLSAGALKSGFNDVATEFEKGTGHKIVAEFMPVGTLLKKLRDGATADLILMTEEGMAEGRAWIDPATVVEIGRVGMGVAVREGAPKPDIATVEAFKATLLAAPRIVYIDPTKGTSGKHFAKVLRDLGIADAVNAKAQLVDAGYVAERVAKGEADLAVHQISEILPVKGVVLVGPLPPALQKISVYQGAVVAKPASADAARALLAALHTPAARQMFAKRGFATAN